MTAKSSDSCLSGGGVINQLHICVRTQPERLNHASALITQGVVVSPLILTSVFSVPQ